MNQVYSLQEVFANRVFHVPDYQRGYSWEQQQWEELLEDLEFLAAKKDHYTGNLVLDRQKGNVVDKTGQRHDIFHIVDGQQRLTTLILLLDAIREKMKGLDDDVASGISRTYIDYKDRNGQRAYRLTLNSDCQDFFENNVLGDKIGPQGPSIASHKRLRDAREHFRNFLNSRENELTKNFGQWLDELYDKVTQRLKVSQYIVGDSTEVGVIFEVMNNRGKSLSELEKVKNYLLYVAAKLELENHNLAEEINGAWAEVFKRLMAANLTSAADEDRLLRAHWILSYDPAKKGWAGSKTVKARFNLKTFHKKHKTLFKQISEYVKSLRNSVLVFAEVFAPNSSSAFTVYNAPASIEIKKWATKLIRTGSLASFVPVLMAVRLKFPKDADAYAQCLKLCELYAFRVYRWGTRRADAGQVRLFRFAYELFHGKTDLDTVSKQMRAMALAYSPDRAFEQEFEADAERNFYTWPGLRYFLYEYEEFLSKGKGLKMSWEMLQAGDAEKTIEHVLPQNPNDPYWKKRFSNEEKRRLTHSIGNLVLTFDNSVYGNKAYPEKRGKADQDDACYYISNLFMEKKIAKDFNDWTPQSVADRSAHLKKWAVSRWHIDASDLDDTILLPDEDTEEED